MPPCLATEADAKTAPANNSNNSSSSSSCSSRPPEQQTKRLEDLLASTGTANETTGRISSSQDHGECLEATRPHRRLFWKARFLVALSSLSRFFLSASDSNQKSFSQQQQQSQTKYGPQDVFQRKSTAGTPTENEPQQQLCKNYRVESGARSSVRKSRTAVKEYLQSLKDICKDQQERCSSGYRSLSPPNETMTILAHWSKDAYYAIVISKNGGIPTIINVMRAFLNTSDSDHEDFSPERAFGKRRNKAHSNASRFQACCARVLFALSNQSEGMKRTIVKEGGVDVILAAARKYPRSIDTEAMASLVEYQLNQEEDKEQEKQEQEESTTRTEDSTGLYPSSGASSLAGDKHNANTTSSATTTTNPPPPSSSEGTHEVVAYF
eukprot:CAMPEP_0178833434 /NCGR_PEP_ID=MMETSP0746-20121128/10550_1 /TAXON_ID=913974 /ORGANISM="Nitzschia punctata, Strain CCMP561" /LENGTH=380 /DNA_ID=CAMNT_0020495859 /DNA_START=114 /DNA_END=1257 /DNA_ORIENTATION=+